MIYKIPSTNVRNTIAICFCLSADTDTVLVTICDEMSMKSTSIEVGVSNLISTVISLDSDYKQYIKDGE